jgi:hypothetical protein
MYAYGESKFGEPIIYQLICKYVKFDRNTQYQVEFNKDIVSFLGIMLKSTIHNLSRILDNKFRSGLDF